HCWAALVGGTGGQHWWAGHRWVALVGSTGGWAQVVAQVGGHRWVALLGTGRWHFWAQVCGHCRVAQVGGTAGHRWCTAGHSGTELVGALLGTGGRNLWVALLGTDHQGTDHQWP
ncbi:unnamed protein product, partial [Staurois parvus]